MANTTAQQVYDSFESSFSDKQELPATLETMWIVKAVAKYSTEITPLNFDPVLKVFDAELEQFTIDVLGQMMKVYYLERLLSRNNKIASIVGHDLSVNSGMSLSKFTESELERVKNELYDMINKLKPSAYS